MCGTTPGDTKTFDEQVCMPINGRVQCIDRCIHHIVAALNAGNVRTVASCCGHKIAPGSIILEDGRCLGIFSSLQAFESAAENKGASGTPTNSASKKFPPLSECERVVRDSFEGNQLRENERHVIGILWAYLERKHLALRKRWA